jgi:glycosyltransferase involved in cell wall biosynthesis
MPTISVVVPAYNAERTILETIASVQQQTFSDFELIVINDGSTDGTLEQLNTVKDARIKVFSYENGGISVARNRGIAQATGEFIAFLDADDLWTPDKLELQLAALQQHPEAGVAYSWTCFMDEQGKSFSPGKQVSFEGNVYAELLLVNFLSHGSNPLIRKQTIESVGGFNTTFSPCADWDFYLRLAAQFSFVLVPKQQIFYRQFFGSMSSKVERLEAESIVVVEKGFQEAPKELKSLKNESIAAIYQYSAELYLRYSNNKISDVNQAGQRLWKAIRLYPPILLHKEIQNLVKWFIKKSVLMRLHLKRQ